MSLDAILEAIQNYGQEQVNQIESATRTQTKEILARAKDEANLIQEQVCREVTEPAFRERSRILHQARMSALRIIGDARQEFVETALEQTRNHLASISSQADYPAVLRRLTQQAFDELKRSLSDIHKATVEINRRDLELMENILAEMDLDLPILTDLTTWGGLIVTSQESKVVVINTLEARLESATPYLRRSLAALLENQECQVSTTEMPVYEQ